MTPTARTASHALIDVSPLAGHHDLSSLAGDIAAMFRKNLALSPSLCKSLAARMVEMMDEIDQDLVNQQAEQEWREAEGRRLAA